MKAYVNPIMEGADPFVLNYDGKYYLYATNAPADGFKVYSSNDMISWVDEGLCLKKEDVMGEGGFWAPEIVYRNGLFYMVYVADEHLGIATSTSPLGPFKQAEKKWISERQAIDGHFFIDDDGAIYLYYVRFDRGNVLYVAPMSNDMLSIDEEKEKFIFRATDEWELKDESVVEGPFVLKHNGRYYLTYSANHTRSPYYAIGYAVCDSPMGEFVKNSANPILKMNEEVNGVGHHSFVVANNGELVCVYHSHYSKTQFVPRTICLDRAKFVSEKGEDKLVINGPTKSPQPAF